MKISKKILSYILSAVFILGTVFAGGGSFPGFVLKADAENIGEYSLNDIIEFGWYPQTKVVDENIIAELNADSGKWISYEYYRGEDDYGKMRPGNWMRYKDVILGSKKYRGVIFDLYRLSDTISSHEGGYSFYQQLYNGYKTKTAYWFEYEPVKWRVLDASKGLVVSEIILDSQAFNNYVFWGGVDKNGNTAFWADSQKIHYANNYEYSSIRKWLNSDFYNTVFSREQQTMIEKTVIDNSSYSNSCSFFDCEETKDKIYLLSYNDVLNNNYGFSYDNITRVATGSDYAECQGLLTFDGNANWFLRTSAYLSDQMCTVTLNGTVNTFDVPTYSEGVSQTFTTYLGVRPAMNLDLNSEIIQSNVIDTGLSSENGIGSTSDIDYKEKYDKGTKVILKYEKGTFDDDIKLVVESKPEQFNTSFKLGGDYERNIYDIYVVDGNGNRVQPRNGRLFELEMPVDESLNGKYVLVIHYLENALKEYFKDVKVVNNKIKIKTNHFSEFVVYEVPDIGIENFKSSFSADYKSKLTFNANITDVGESNIHWFVNGKDVQTGSAYTIDSAVEKEYEVQIKVIVDGETVSESEVETVKVKTNFFAKLIAFFRGLFGKLPEYVDNKKI